MVYGCAPFKRPFTYGSTYGGNIKQFKFLTLLLPIIISIIIIIGFVYCEYPEYFFLIFFSEPVTF